MCTFFKKLLLWSILTFPFTLNATHMMGAEVTYRSLGNKKYELTAKIYRDCRGMAFNNPLCKVSDYKGISFTLSYTRTSIEDITLRCEDSVSGPCTPQNTTAGTGVELHTYVDTIDFGASPYTAFQANNSCQIYFSVEQYARNSAITTIDYGNLYVDAMLDICNSNFRNTSPQFKSRNVMFASCNLPFNQNFGAKDFVDYDSIAYELTAPLIDSGTSVTYFSPFSKAYPMTPFCITPGVVNCSPLPNAKPPRGFYFNKLNGDIVFTPANCTETGVIAMKASEYRWDSNNKKWLLVGYVIRDLQIMVIKGGENLLPKVTLASTYNFTTRNNTCIDIETSDTANVSSPGYDPNNKGDKSFLSILELPPGATFRYVDSSAKHKTGRLCWNIPDSVYLKFRNKNKLLPMTVNVWDNFCYIPGKIQKSFSIKMLPPDSSGYLTVNTYIDVNKNKRKDTTDKPVSSLLKFKDKYSPYYIDTDDKGEFTDFIGIGKVNIGIASHPYFTSVSKDTNLLVKMDSAHRIDLGVKRNKGIYGRIYEDANNNCQFDKNELPYFGYKVFTDSNKFMGISDRDGIYLIDAPQGSYTLTCDYKPSLLSVNCPSTRKISISINGDSAYLDNDFGISKNMDYTDISAGIDIGRLRRGNLSSVTFHCVNNGPTTRKNIELYYPVNNNFDLTYNSTLFAKAGTMAVIRIDSIPPYQKFSKKLDFYLSPTNFAANEKLCFSVATDSSSKAQDSVKTNNTANACRIIEAPFDPNEKRISVDSSKTILDKTIDYTIHFQNTGTDTAVRVIVVDTIDTKYLDLSQFNMNWSDFPCQTIVTGNVLHFIFDDINLPFLSVSGDKSIAGFNFTLGLRSDWPEEKLFSNKASIFFDFEKPVITAKAIATINSPLVFTKIDHSTVCRNIRNKIHYKSNITLNADNQVILELSDKNGSFNSPTVLKSISTSSVIDSIDFALPSSLSAATYKLRLRSTNPVSISIPGNGIISMDVISQPVFQVNPNIKNNIACEKDTLKIKLANAGNPYLFQVYKNGLSMGPFSLLNMYEFPVMKDSFLFIAKDPVTACLDSSKLKPNVFTKPVITAFIPNRKNEYCGGEQLDLVANGGLRYAYIKNKDTIAKWSNASTYNTTLNNTSIYKVSGEDINGCRNTSDTMMVKVNPAPLATISSLPDPICKGDSVVMLVFDPAYNYDVYQNNIKILSKSSSQTFMINNPVDGDTYRTTAYSDMGCTSNSSDLIIDILPAAPIPVIIRNQNNLSVNYSGKIKWYKNGVLLSITDSFITNAPSGIYRVIITNPEGCSSSSNAVKHFNSGLKETMAGQFKIYPNPASQDLTVENINSDEPFTFRIYDMNGKLMIESSDNVNGKTIDIGDFSSGVYTLRIEAGNGVSFNRMISIVR